MKLARLLRALIAMTRDRDIWRGARLMIDRHGAVAPLRAAQRAKRLFDDGNFYGAELWWRIADAIDELARATPADGERVN
jgi:hypothetical protein